MARIDTHILVWLFAGELKLLSKSARAVLEEQPIAASPLVRLELAYLHDIGRISVAPTTVLETLEAELGLSLSDCSLSDVVARAEPLTWTRDPFDRLLVADAIVADDDFVTKDRTIRANHRRAVW